MEILLLALLGLGVGMALLEMFGSNDEDGADDTPGKDDLQPPTDENDGTDGDTGAVVTEAAGVISVALGAEETGSLLAVKIQDSSTTDNLVSGHPEYVDAYELRLFLVPEGENFPVDFSNNAFSAPDLDELDELVADLGLEELARYDLGSVITSDDEVTDTRTEPPEIRSDDAIGVVRVNSYDGTILSTETDETMSPFEDATPYFDGVTATQVSADAVGGPDTDWLVVEPGTSGITVDGAGGDDRIDNTDPGNRLLGGDGDDLMFNSGDLSTLEGGDGNDTLHSDAAGDLLVRGDAGDDFITAADGSEVHGGQGDDQIYIHGDTETETLVYGEAGNDGINLSGANTVGFGGAGADFVGVSNGATGHGGAGNDHLQLDDGTTGFGGDGDDLFTVWNQFSLAGAVATGGDGADTFDVGVWNPSGETDDIYLRITDFDVAEDMLQVGVFQTSNTSVQSVTANEAADGSYTDVEVRYTNDHGLPDGIATIRLEGVTGFDPAMVQITA